MEELKLNQTQEQRLQVIEDLRKEGIDPYGARFDRSHSAEEVKAYFADAEAKVEEKEHFATAPVKIAGRIMSKRDQGKTAFIHIVDQSGKIQLYIRKDAIGDDAFAMLKRLYAGDIIGVEGPAFRTRTGEISVRAEKITILSKSITAPPEKFHGLTDVELRYRHRYVDLMSNPEVRETFIKRSQIVQNIRGFMTGKGFLEVETPMMHTIAGGAAARPFVTHHNALDMQLFLRIAPELYLKRLLVGGFEKVFEINRNFRNEGISIKHNPEFTMMEVYQAYGDMDTMMELTEEVLCHAAENIYPDLQVPYQDQTLNFKRPWRRVQLLDLVKEASGCNELAYDCPRDLAAAQAHKLHVSIEPTDSSAKIIVKIYDEKIESTLINPTFVYGYPKETSPLAKGSKDDATRVDRFELFMYGREMANAFSELNDPEEQLKRFEDQLHQREAGDDEAHQMDSDYINALRYGMPPAGGLGIGIDRVVMLLTNSASIRDVILFPTLRRRVAGDHQDIEEQTSGEEKTQAATE
ncbi:MAG: lysine--tRNA ligase [Candidatus Riflebacteria bacterium GWC2_50_8]|nr:MAG: lysine--tRNA ligase [Candidatus Riflebacteria bacterium GWC2_50_8]